MHDKITCTTIPLKNIIRIIIFNNSNVRGSKENFLKVILVIAFIYFFTSGKLFQNPV